jgi:hypothetical protein
MLTKKEAIELVGKAGAKSRFGDELGGRIGIPSISMAWLLSKIYGGGELEILNTIHELETKEYNRLRLEFLKQNKERKKRLARA